MKTTIGIIDDHRLFLKSLGLMLRSFNDYDVILEAVNGKDMQEKMARSKTVPSMMLIDVNMPEMNGVETAAWLHAHHPEIKLVALSMNDADNFIIDMIKAGCCAYLLKETHPDEFEKALREIDTRGYYNAGANNINLGKLLVGKDSAALTEKEKIFLQHACSDMTYREIAALMFLSERTIDGYRESLFAKFKVNSRVGLAMEAIRRGLVTV